MRRNIRLLSTDFDGTLVAHHLNGEGESMLDAPCMQMIRALQDDGAIWAINTGRSVDLLETGLNDFAFPTRPDFILTSERDVFRPCENGQRWEAYGDWNDRVARDHAELFTSAASVLDEVLDFVNGKTRARVIHDRHGPEGLIAHDEEEMERITAFVDRAREREPRFNYQRNTVYMRFCHSDYHKGAALAELSRLTGIPREETFAAGDHHNDLSMLDGRYAEFPACPGNAIPEVKTTVRNAGGYVAKGECGAGVHEALLYFTS